MSNPQHTHVLVAGGGYWGRGKTFHEAVEQAKYLTKGSRVMVAPCHAETRVNEVGNICYPKDCPIGEIAYGVVTGTKKNYTFKTKG